MWHNKDDCKPNPVGPEPEKSSPIIRVLGAMDSQLVILSEAISVLTNNVSPFLAPSKVDGYSGGFPFSEDDSPIEKRIKQLNMTILNLTFIVTDINNRWRA